LLTVLNGEISVDQTEFSDVGFVERLDQVGVIVSIPGRYSLADRRDARGERRVYACRAVYLSPYEIALAAPVSGKIGERVLADIDKLGKLQGPLIRQLKRGFVMSVAANEENRRGLAAKIAWVESNKNHDTPNQRVGDRTIPANPYSKLVFGDGSVETCLVLDYSVTGAAVSADTVPDIKAVLAVGSVVGRVVRHFEGGFAVKFIQRQSPDTVEALVLGE
jgi:hypothetical protein